jgi:hypothetical protein
MKELTDSTIIDKAIQMFVCQNKTLIEISKECNVAESCVHHWITKYLGPKKNRSILTKLSTWKTDIAD